MSGYSEGNVHAELSLPGAVYLQKPFTLGSLIDKVKDVLSSEPDS
jgi:hypothetical protein